MPSGYCREDRLGGVKQMLGDQGRGNCAGPGRQAIMGARQGEKGTWRKMDKFMRNLRGKRESISRPVACAGEGGRVMVGPWKDRAAFGQEGGGHGKSRCSWIQSYLKPSGFFRKERKLAGPG